MLYQHLSHPSSIIELCYFLYLNDYQFTRKISSCRRVVREKHENPPCIHLHRPRVHRKNTLVHVCSSSVKLRRASRYRYLERIHAGRISFRLANELFIPQTRHDSPSRLLSKTSRTSLIQTFSYAGSGSQALVIFSRGSLLRCTPTSSGLVHSGDYGLIRPAINWSKSLAAAGGVAPTALPTLSSFGTTQTNVPYRKFSSSTVQRFHPSRYRRKVHPASPVGVEEPGR